VRVHLSTKVPVGHVYLSLVDETNNLDIVGSFKELETSQGALGDEAGTVARLGAPGNHLAFDVSDSLAGLRRGPQAEIYIRRK